jgi:hypothetical protein
LNPAPHIPHTDDRIGGIVQCFDDSHVSLTNGV